MPTVAPSNGGQNQQTIIEGRPPAVNDATVLQSLGASSGSPVTSNSASVTNQGGVVKTVISSLIKHQPSSIFTNGGDKISSTLYEYYVTETASALSIRTGHDNPFVNLVLPLALQSKILWSAILALGGVHLHYRNKSRDIGVIAWYHYGEVIKELKSMDLDYKNWFPNKQAETLLVIMLLCILEVSIFSPVSHIPLHSTGSVDGSCYESPGSSCPCTDIQRES
jgi:hypothetical protein